ncbi:hypothetical protein NEMBOFW57_001986 [Staphylotrichum longicolle]|uniref:Uncharacterized protein n=1 Tax=Staphylotrichum longicolle TaxID=669026 RepID=A0AAD4F2H3_9PEZI|nr:hypothetical protein NEMBOFW57_001986 [Staphylotrichum longicolle]
MGHSYTKNPSTTARTPPQWKDQIPHKYCGKIDDGRLGKPNKAHRCEACLVVKGQQAKSVDGPNNIKLFRWEKTKKKFELKEPDVVG